MPVHNPTPADPHRLFAVRPTRVARGQKVVTHLAPQALPRHVGDVPYPGPGPRALCGSSPASHFHQVSGVRGPSSDADVCPRCVARIKPEHVLPYARPEREHFAPVEADPRGGYIASCWCGTVLHTADTGDDRADLARAEGSAEGHRLDPQGVTPRA